EQAGLLDVPVDERADLYSVGVLLFECLAGRPPFEGRSVGEVLRQHLSVTPPELRGLGVDVPRALDAVVQRLLRKDPADRYQAAQRPFHLLEGVAADLLAAAEGNPGVAAAISDRLGDHAETVVATLPELGPLFGRVGEGDVGPEAYGEARSLLALPALLDAL